MLVYLSIGPVFYFFFIYLFDYIFTPYTQECLTYTAGINMGEIHGNPTTTWKLLTKRAGIKIRFITL